MEQARLIIETDDNITTVNVIVGKEIVRTSVFDFSEISIYSGRNATRKEALGKHGNDIDQFYCDLVDLDYEVPEHFFTQLQAEMECIVDETIDELIND